MRTGRLVVVFLTLLVGGSADASWLGFENYRRPIVDTKLPGREVYRRLFLGMADNSRLGQAHSKSSAAHHGFIVARPDGFVVEPNIVRAAQAVELNPRDPRAHEILGVYLGLAHEFEAAIEALETAIDEAQRLRASGRSGVQEYLGDLETRCLLNIALLASLAGDQTTALAAVDAVPVTVSESRRLAKHWIYALIAAQDDPERAGEELRAAAGVEVVATTELRLYYPHFVDPRRRQAVQHYLEGLVALGAGFLEEAEELLGRAVEQDDDLHDARLALANALLEQGRFNDADGELEELAAERPSGEMYSTETIDYNRGNVFLAAGRPEDAIDHFEDALEKVADRACEYLGHISLSRWARDRCDTRAACADLHHLRLDCDASLCRAGSRSLQPVSPVPSVGLVCDSLRPQPFVAASNNLAVALMDAGRVGEVRELLEPLLDYAGDQGAAFPVRLNWARYLWLSGARDNARSEIEELARLQPTSTARLVWGFFDRAVVDGTRSLAAQTDAIRLWLDLVGGSDALAARPSLHSEVAILERRIRQGLAPSPERDLLLFRIAELHERTADPFDPALDQLVPGPLDEIRIDAGPPPPAAGSPPERR